MGDIYPFVGEMAWTKIYDVLTKLKALDIISDPVFSRLKGEMMDHFEHFTKEKPIGGFTCTDKHVGVCGNDLYTFWC